MIVFPQTQLEPVPVCAIGQFRSWVTVDCFGHTREKVSRRCRGYLVLVRRYEHNFVGLGCCGGRVDRNVDLGSGESHGLTLEGAWDADAGTFFGLVRLLIVRLCWTA
jgi:hypothetical protein